MQLVTGTFQVMCKTENVVSGLTAPDTAFGNVHGAVLCPAHVFFVFFTPIVVERFRALNHQQTLRFPRQIRPLSVRPQHLFAYHAIHSAFCFSAKI